MSHGRTSEICTSTSKLKKENLPVRFQFNTFRLATVENLFLKASSTISPERDRKQSVTQPSADFIFPAQKLHFNMVGLPEHRSTFMCSTIALTDVVLL